jgi:small subunit ribosomal protein S13
MPKEYAEEKAAGKPEESAEESAQEKAGEKSEERDVDKAGEEAAPAKEEAVEEGAEKELPQDAEDAEEEAAGDDQDEEEPTEEGAAGEPKEKEPEKEKRQAKGGARKIVRIGSKDLDGGITLRHGLKYVPGMSFMFANAVSTVCGFADKKIGDLSEDELKKVEDIIANPGKHGISPWLFNRRFDPEDGSDKHLISAQLELKRKMDINELKKRKCYRGVRHIIGLPVRGQRTRSSFRKSATVGVSRVKAKQGARK